MTVRPDRRSRRYSVEPLVQHANGARTWIDDANPRSVTSDPPLQSNRRPPSPSSVPLEVGNPANSTPRGVRNPFQLLGCQPATAGIAAAARWADRSQIRSTGGADPESR